MFGKWGEYPIAIKEYPITKGRIQAIHMGMAED